MNSEYDGLLWVLSGFPIVPYLGSPILQDSLWSFFIQISEYFMSDSLMPFGLGYTDATHSI